MIIASEAAGWAEQVAGVFGSSAEAVLHYGSRAQGRAPRFDSAWDFIVIVSSYGAAYAAAAAALGPRSHPRRARLLARILPPNSIAIRRSDRPEDSSEAKCLVISHRDFARECSADARDHFIQARITQQVLLAWSRDPGCAESALGAVHAARCHALDWVPVFLPPAFDLDDFCRKLIAVPYAHELRAEAAGHAGILFDAQRDMLRATYGPLLEDAARRGSLVRAGDGYRAARPAGRFQQLRVRTWFRRSKWRTTARLLKHPFLYEDWLGYLLRKVERHTGQRIELTARERRHPLIFLWPRTLRFLRSRPQRGDIA